VVRATAKPGGDLPRVERAIDEELARFIQTGPTASELRRVKTQSRANFIRRRRADRRLRRQVRRVGAERGIHGSADHYLVDAATHRGGNGRRSQVSRGALAQRRRVGARGASVSHVRDPRRAAPTASKLPDAGTPPDARFPAIARATLPNGLKIVLAERHSIPQVQLTLLVDAGYAADQFAAPGTASLALDMLDEGTTRRTALQISDTLSQLGAAVVYELAARRVTRRIVDLEGEPRSGARHLR